MLYDLLPHVLNGLALGLLFALLAGCVTLASNVGSAADPPQPAITNVASGTSALTAGNTSVAK